MHERFIHREASWHAGLEASINRASRLTLSVTVNPASVTINSDSNSDGMSILQAGTPGEQGPEAVL